MAGKSGFTLIEILIAVTLLGIFATLISGNYFTSLKSGRDARRKSDIKTIQNSLEQYYSACGFVYPTPQGDGSFADITCLTPSLAILPTVPVDPKTADPYGCSSCDDSSYTICAVLEVQTPADFCLSNQQ